MAKVDENEIDIAISRKSGFKKRVHEKNLSCFDVLTHLEKCRITKTRLFKYIETFTSKNWKFSNVLTSTHNLCLWVK